MTGHVPRLRVERIVIVESRQSLAFIRDISLHAGLNIVWAEEQSVTEGTTDVERAGHGVGKSTFCMMLRAVLGDEGAAVETMCRHLADHYGSGGIAAEVVAGTERFAVFRSFGSKSFAARNATVERLLAGDVEADALDFSSYVVALGEQACLQHMPARALPVSGQAVEWAHVVCWIARDQALGLCKYFDWRAEDAGRREVKNPQAIVRLVLGLLSDAEAKAEKRISRAKRELSSARDALRTEDQRTSNTRSIVEAQLRQWAGVANNLDMVSDDLFADSVHNEIKRKTRQLEAMNEHDRAAVVALDRKLLELTADIKTQERTVEIAKTRWDETVALRTRDLKALEAIRTRRDELLTIAGNCQYGAVAYSDCTYVQSQRDVLPLRMNRDLRVLGEALNAQDDREISEKTELDAQTRKLAELMAERDEKIAAKAKLTEGLEKRLRQLGEGDSVLKTLGRWQESNESAETEKVRAARVAVVDRQKRLEAAKAAKIAAQQQTSEREREVSARIAKLADQLGAAGRYVASDETRPFQMLRADGDAYTVLEILLGDLACAEDGANDAGAHPGLLIFDCPREREMGGHLYARFLTLVAEVCTHAPKLQVIITTTTPPPEPLREPPTRILKLSRASDDQLLLKRRIANLLTRAMPASSDASKEP